MARRQARNPQLRDRDWEILEHVARYRMTTPDVLHRLFWENDDGRTAVTKVTSRLTDYGFLNRYDFIHPKSYFVLGPNGTKAFGIPQKRSNALGPQSLCSEHGVLAYCCLREERQERLTVRELQEFNPAYLQKGVESSPYYLHTVDGRTSLTFIRVDGGGSVDHVVRKCKRDYQQRAKVPAFRELVDQGRFAIAVVTGMVPQDAKVKEVEEALARQNLPIRFFVASVPDLVELW